MPEFSAASFQILSNSLFINDPSPIRHCVVWAIQAVLKYRGYFVVQF
jgi:hypothetical protein